jgi:predicted GIY-YIG superfamily endonuclease
LFLLVPSSPFPAFSFFLRRAYNSAAESRSWPALSASTSSQAARVNLYVGVTNNVERRLVEHREGKVKGFTTRYGIHRLVHFEQYEDVRYAIAREKEIKAWRREKK